MGEADIWRPEGASAARPNRPVPASSWLVAVTVIPAEDFTREPRYSCRIYHPAPCGPGFLVPGPRRTVDEVRVWVWPPPGRAEQGQFPSVAANRNPKLFSQLNELYWNASTAHRANDNYSLRDCFRRPVRPDHRDRPGLSGLAGSGSRRVPICPGERATPSRRRRQFRRSPDTPTAPAAMASGESGVTRLTRRIELNLTPPMAGHLKARQLGYGPLLSHPAWTTAFRCSICWAMLTSW